MFLQYRLRRFTDDDEQRFERPKLEPYGAAGRLRHRLLIDSVRATRPLGAIER